MHWDNGTRGAPPHHLLSPALSRHLPSPSTALTHVTVTFILTTALTSAVSASTDATHPQHPNPTRLTPPRHTTSVCAAPVTADSTREWNVVGGERMMRREIVREAAGLHLFPRWFFVGPCVLSPLCLLAYRLTTPPTVFCCHVLFHCHLFSKSHFTTQFSTTPPFSSVW